MIIKRGKTWWLDIWVGHGKTRKRVRRSLHTDERTLALARAQEVAAELERGRQSGPDISSLASQYLTWAKSAKPNSYQDEKYEMDWILSWFKAQGISSIKQITPYQVEQMRIAVRARDRRTKEDPGKPAREASGATANRYCALLRTFINRIKDWGQYDGLNPVSKVRFYKENGKVAPLTDDDLKKVNEAAAAIAAEARSPLQRLMPDLIELSINTGLRKSEALELKWRDVQTDEIEVTGKRDKTRRIPLNKAALAVIERQPKTAGAFVFDIPNRSREDVFRRTIVRIRQKSGVAHFHFHLCRHRFATALLKAGVDLQTVADLLGHSRYMTSLLYAHSTPDSRRRAVNALTGRGGLDTKVGHCPADSKKTKLRKSL